MLASIVPLVERARNRNWGLTVAAYLVGSVLGGSLLGAISGLVGQAAFGHTGLGLGVDPRLLLVAATAACALGAAIDLGLAGLALPTVRRQVNEDWLNRYRGWVYGLGFGFQLGLGVVTIVTSATVYLVFVLGLLSASWPAAALFGATFGLVRAVPVLAAARVANHSQLRDYHRRMQRRAPMASRATIGMQCAVAAIALAGAVR